MPAGDPPGQEEEPGGKAREAEASKPEPSTSMCALTLAPTSAAKLESINTINRVLGYLAKGLQKCSVIIGSLTGVLTATVQNVNLKWKLQSPKPYREMDFIS